MHQLVAMLCCVTPMMFFFGNSHKKLRLHDKARVRSCCTAWLSLFQHRPKKPILFSRLTNAGTTVTDMYILGAPGGEVGEGGCAPRHPCYWNACRRTCCPESWVSVQTPPIPRKSFFHFWSITGFHRFNSRPKGRPDVHTPWGDASKILLRGTTCFSLFCFDTVQNASRLSQTLILMQSVQFTPNPGSARVAFVLFCRDTMQLDLWICGFREKAEVNISGSA